MKKHLHIIVGGQRLCFPVEEETALKISEELKTARQNPASVIVGVDLSKPIWIRPTDVSAVFITDIPEPEKPNPISVEMLNIMRRIVKDSQNGEEWKDGSE